MQRTSIMMIICWGALLLSSCSQHLSESKITAIEQEVLEVHKRIFDALENGDVDEMSEHILDSDETIIQTNDIVQTRNEALASIRSVFVHFKELRYQFTEKQITVSTPMSAEMFTKGLATSISNEDDIHQSSFTQTLHFVLTDNGWKVHRAHYISGDD
jgi:PBP1b-binding outer membrane lipoprotein LpoB